MKQHTLAGWTTWAAALVLGAVVVVPAVADRGPHADDHKPAAEADERQRPGGSERGPRGSRRWDDVNPDDALDVLRDQNPDFADRLTSLRESDPERFQAMLNRLMPRLAEMVRLRRDDPQMYALRVHDAQLSARTFDLSRRVHAMRRDEDTDPAELERLTEQFRAVVVEHFNVRQEMRELELDRLEQRLADLRAELEERKAHRDELIEQRLERLRGPSDLPDW